jgi:hypothetical protein
MAGLKAVILNFDFLSTKQEWYTATVPLQLGSSTVNRDSTIAIRFQYGTPRLSHRN